MYHLRVPVFLLAALVLLRCIAAAPNHRYFRPSSSSSDEEENALVDKESRSLSELISNPFLSLKRARPQRQIHKRESGPPSHVSCSTRSCLDQRLADYMRRYKNLDESKRTDVGKNSFGKRDIHQPPVQLPV